MASAPAVPPSSAPSLGATTDASPKSTAPSTTPILGSASPSATAGAGTHHAHHPPAELKTRTALLLIGLIFLLATTALALVYLSFPDLEPNEAEHVKFPKDIEDAKKLGLVLSHYKDRYFFQVLGGVLVTYLFLQTFAIPGSIFLSIVSGFLFPFPVALLVICFCSATGASFCYLLSYLVGRRLVKTYLPERAASWSEKVQHHQSNLLSYIIFLRITPFLPNWFINIVSPVIDVPLGPFWLGTFVGVAPPSFVAIQAGTTLQQMTSTAEALTFQSVALLVAFALLSIVPVIFRDRKKIQAFIVSCYAHCRKLTMGWSCCCGPRPHVHGTPETQTPPPPLVFPSQVPQPPTSLSIPAYPESEDHSVQFCQNEIQVRLEEDEIPYDMKHSVSS